MKYLLALLLTAVVLQSQTSPWSECMKDKNKSLDIDCAIAWIMKAPPQKRRVLMNELKREIFKLNLELQTSHLLHLRNIISNHPPSRGTHK